MKPDRTEKKLSRKERQVLRDLLFRFLKQTLYDADEPVSSIISATQAIDQGMRESKKPKRGDEAA